MQNYQEFKVDLSNCDKEPIHLIGRIQPHGFLMVLNGRSYEIEQVSRNIGDFIPLEGDGELLGKSIFELLPPESKSWFLHTFLASGHEVIELGSSSFSGFSHRSGEKLILECEPFTNNSNDDQLKQLDKLSILMYRLNQLDDPFQMAGLVAKELQQYLGYDRVNVMRFDKKWNSEVIGESLKGSTVSFLGHRFPSTDIPLPARKLLLEKTIRQIPDVKATAVSISPYINPSSGVATDILKSELRNPSEIHLEYLNNMGVGATLSFSIIANDNLWGVISCHHFEPMFVDALDRKIGYLMTQGLASEITSIQKSEDLKEFKKLTDNRLSLVERLEKHTDLVSGLTEEHLDIVAITMGCGAAIVIDQKVFSYGLTPTEEEINNIIEWLYTNVNKKIFCTKSLWKDIPEASHYKDVVCGMMALEISKYNREYLLFFKPEIPRKRIWAGNPEEPLQKKDDYIHPRKSFRKWEETVRGKSQGWNTNEQEVAKIFLKDLTALQLRDQAVLLNHLNSQLQTNAQRLAVKNRQLEDFGLIMAHNLRGPMNNILLLHEFYQEEPTEAHATFVFQKTPTIVENMINTMEDLNKIIDTRLEDDLPTEEVGLVELIEKEWNNLQTEELQSARAELSLDLRVPVLFLPKIYAESILHNFISNALKYRALDRQPLVKVKSWKDEGQVYLSVSDNGLGMDLHAVKEKLFGLYKTFHFHEQAKGMGLYLTKIQIEALGGDISVESEPDKGSTFTASFPKVRVLNLD